jgi:3-oxoacyl-(acyl-carrier-protein) synthase
VTPRRRVAITGIGMVTPVGNDAPTTWAKLVGGRSGVAPIASFDARGFPTRIGAEIGTSTWKSIITDRKLLKFASRSHRFALAAAEEALRDAGIRPEPSTRRRWGLTVGAGMMGVAFNELETVHAQCAREGELNPDGFLREQFPADPVAFCRSQTNAGLALLARHFGIKVTPRRAYRASGDRLWARR